MEFELAKINKATSINVKDVPSHNFIKEFAEHLKKTGKFKVPEWIDYVKSSTFKELAPYDQDWLYTRAASIARQIYMRKRAGVGALRTHYGGLFRRGTVPSTFKRATAKVIRHCLKELTRLGYLEMLTLQDEDDQGNTVELCTVGRAVSKRGRADMDRIAVQIARKIYPKN